MPPSNHTSHAHLSFSCHWVNANLYSKLSNLCAMSIMLVACSSEHLGALVRTGSNFCGFRQWKSVWFSLEHTKFRHSSLHRTKLRLMQDFIYFYSPDQENSLYFHSHSNCKKLDWSFLWFCWFSAYILLIRIDLYIFNHFMCS